LFHQQSLAEAPLNLSASLLNQTALVLLDLLVIGEPLAAVWPPLGYRNNADSPLGVWLLRLPRWLFRRLRSTPLAIAVSLHRVIATP
jgi:hypothetical protein